MCLCKYAKVIWKISELTGYYRQHGRQRSAMCLGSRQTNITSINLTAPKPVFRLRFPVGSHSDRLPGIPQKKRCRPVEKNRLRYCAGCSGYPLIQSCSARPDQSAGSLHMAGPQSSFDRHPAHPVLVQTAPGALSPRSTGTRPSPMPPGGSGGGAINLR